MMTPQTTIQQDASKAKKSFWALLIFYLLIGFEIVYMISPFALYYYSVYGQGLSFVSDIGPLAWLTRFFLPHVTETASPLLNSLGAIGWALAVIGFSAFCVGAAQIYYYKFTRKGAVTGGIYNFIRHPQYLSLSVCSFGLLLVWPRYLVLISLITMLFAYYFLARAEEKECEQKYGCSYLDYKGRTNMFLPFRVPFFERLPSLPPVGLTRVAVIAGLYALTLATGLGLVGAVRSYAVDNLIVAYTENSATISVMKMETATLSEITTIGLNDAQVQQRLAEIGSGVSLINYVMPADWYLGDIPMNMEANNEGHIKPDDYDPNLYRVVFTQAQIDSNEAIQGKQLILNTTDRIPLFQVEVDLKGGKVVRIVEIAPDSIRWSGFPTPIF